MLLVRAWSGWLCCCWACGWPAARVSRALCMLCTPARTHARAHAHAHTQARNRGACPQVAPQPAPAPDQQPQPPDPHSQAALLKHGALEALLPLCLTHGGLAPPAIATQVGGGRLVMLVRGCVVSTCCPHTCSPCPKLHVRGSGADGPGGHGPRLCFVPGAVGVLHGGASGGGSAGAGAAGAHECVCVCWYVQCTLRLCTNTPTRAWMPGRMHTTPTAAACLHPITTPRARAPNSLATAAPAPCPPPPCQAVLRTALHSPEAPRRAAAEHVVRAYCHANPQGQVLLASTIAPVGVGGGGGQWGGGGGGGGGPAGLTFGQELAAALGLGGAGGARLEASGRCVRVRSPGCVHAACVLGVCVA